MDLTLPPDFKEFLKLLKEHDVRYLLIVIKQELWINLTALKST